MSPMRLCPPTQFLQGKLPIEFIELSPAWIWQGNCFMGIESTFYNSVVAPKVAHCPDRGR